MMFMGNVCQDTKWARATEPEVVRTQERLIAWRENVLAKYREV